MLATLSETPCAFTHWTLLKTPYTFTYWTRFLETPYTSTHWTLITSQVHCVYQGLYSVTKMLSLQSGKMFICVYVKKCHPLAEIMWRRQ